MSKIVSFSSSRTLRTKPTNSSVSCGFIPAVGVQQQELGLRPERASHLEAPLVTVGQVARVVVSTSRQPAVVEQLACALMASRARAGPSACAGCCRRCHPSDGMHADEDVLERGHLLEEADVLERPADTALGGVCGGEPAMSLPSNTTRPDVGL